jgi:ParB family chromosome partitioning protein
MRTYVPLSKLRPGPENPRKVKPRPEDHRRMVASIRSFGLIQPLVVRPVSGDAGEYEVIAGGRRLKALRQIYRSTEEDPKISCEVRNVDDSTAEGMSLAENFIREPMHPLDEAEAFAKLAIDEASGAEAIAAKFGVTEHYVRQRMKLAGLAEVVKAAFREDRIDIGTAEAFSAVPEDRQLAVWQEVGGNPRHAQQVRNIIAGAWIDSGHARFELSEVPEGSVSRDLFNDQVLIERSAFFEAQGRALTKEAESLREDGWAEVVITRQEDVQDRLYAMNAPPPEFDEKTNRKLAKLQERRERLEGKLETFGEGEGPAADAIQEKIAGLDELAQQVVEDAPQQFGEKTKAVGSVFLLIGPDGQVRREYRVPRAASRRSANGNGSVGGGTADSPEEPNTPTAGDLSDRQLAATFTHQVLAVREALLGAPAVRKRLLAMILNEKLRCEALAIRHEPNGVSLHASQGETFKSEVYSRLSERRSELDPFFQEHYVKDDAAYQRLSKLPDAKIGRLIDLLLVDCLTGHPQRKTELIEVLSAELKVGLRRSWRPDAAWLDGYRKIQLADLMAELRGKKMYDPAQETRKKSELVDTLAKLFTDAADGKLEDKELAERANAWLPVNLRASKPQAAQKENVS